MTIFHLALGALLCFLALYATARVKLWRKRRLERRFQADRVHTEEVALFRIRGCQRCGGCGTVKRAAPVLGGQRAWMPCLCASTSFLDLYRDDTHMLGPYRVWKRGRRPSREQLARRATRRAAA